MNWQTSRKVAFYLPLSAVVFGFGMLQVLQYSPPNLRPEILAKGVDSVLATKDVATSHPPILYGHVHMAKTGGTSLNGILANTFERICGHKGYSYDAFQENERAKILEKKGEDTFPKGRSRVSPPTMKEIGFEDCDYISQESGWNFWTNTFENGTFHGLKMELHVPCRNRIDHLMSQCNYLHKKITCNAKTDEELFKSVKNCYLELNRYDHKLQNHFDVKCFDFKKQFTDYLEHMSGILQKRRIQSSPYVKRETNDPRNRTNECIWGNATVLKKVEKYLLENVPYYQFCDQCMGSENEITVSVSANKNITVSAGSTGADVRSDDAQRL